MRANFTFARTDGRDGTPSSIGGIQGFRFTRCLYDGDVQLRYPFRVGVAPHLFAGAEASR